MWIWTSCRIFSLTQERTANWSETAIVFNGDGQQTVLLVSFLVLLEQQ